MTTSTVGQAAVAVKDDQIEFSAPQISTLRRYFGEGVRGATNADYALLFQQMRRTGLDPFSRQIYLIMRESWSKEARAKVPTPTIQIGIDGFRLIAKRAAKAEGVRIKHHNPVWIDEDGIEYKAWLKKGKAPSACRYMIEMVPTGDTVEMTVHMDEYMPLMDEYAGSGPDRKKTGNRVPMGLWATMPASQLAKCAEAVTLRKGFPQDLSGLYAEEEMDQQGIIDLAPIQTSEGVVHQDPTPAEPVDAEVDWADEVEKCQSGTEITDLWTRIRAANAMTKELDAALRAKGVSFRPAEPEKLGECILTGAEGEVADDHATHDHAPVE